MSLGMALFLVARAAYHDLMAWLEQREPQRTTREADELLDHFY